MPKPVEKPRARRFSHLFARRFGLDLVAIGRATIGGLLMGLANLVPGISGGTMLLAAGVYPDFIDGVAGVTTFRWRHRSVAMLFLIVTAAFAALLLFAGAIHHAVIHQHAAMYSIFIGLTLGGLPIVWRLARPVSSGFWVAFAVAFAAMLAMAFLEPRSGSESNPLLLVAAGLAGASAMILPGVSGGYLLLLLGQYLPILGAIDALKSGLPGLRTGTLEPELIAALWVLVPVGLGVVVGVVGVSNALRVALERFRQPTLGTLLGLILGAVAGLWPFETVSETGERIARYLPDLPEAALAIALVGVGFAATLLIGRLGGDARLD
jgi:putative membrane protein